MTNIMNTITTIVIAVLSSSALSTFISRLFDRFEKKKDLNNDVNKSLRLLMKDRLRFLCNRYIQQGWIYEDELEDIIAMHQCYHDDLNGNGYLDELMKRVRSLEIRGVGI